MGYRGGLYPRAKLVLGSGADVDDVFQATFLVLLRKPGAIRKQRSVGSWLYGVAHRLAVQSRDCAARRQRLERRAGKPEADSPDLSWREARSNQFGFICVEATDAIRRKSSYPPITVNRGIIYC